MFCESSLLASTVQKCRSAISLKRARQLHARLLAAMTIIPQPMTPYLSNNVLSMYGRCGSLRDARKVFDKMPQRNVVSFNALISVYSRFRNEAVSALRLSAQMGFECLRPNGLTFISLLQVTSVVEERFAGTLFHCQVVKFGFVNDPKVQTSLLGMYSNCGDIVSSSMVFRFLVDKDVVAWNSILFGNLKNGHVHKGIELFYDMLRVGVTPNQFTHSMVLKACGELGYHQLGKLVHARVVISNSPPDLTLLNSLLDMYCNCGDIEAAFALFLTMENCDLVSWNSMISGCTAIGDGDMAFCLFVQLKGMSVEPDEYTFAAVVSASSKCVASRCGKPLHGQVIKAGFEESVFVGSALVSMYFENGEAEAAEKVFFSIPKKDVVIWTEMITNHSRLENGDNAIRFFREMHQEGHKADSFSLSGTLSVCADMAILRQGEMVHSQVVKTGCEAEMSVCGSLVDMYAKNGVIEASHKAFSQARNHDLKCWNAMLGGYSHHGMMKEALEIFGKILKCGLQPDQVTFLSILSACNHSGLVEQGKLFWNFMKENGIDPGLKHYCCMVSLFSRAGLLDEAEEMIIAAPFGRGNVELWRTLLSSCAIRKNLSVGIHAAEQVLKLDVEDSATHILLSNLYAVLGKWDEVSKMRRNIRGWMLEKDPGLSWFEDRDSNVQVFSSGESYLETVEAEIASHRLVGNMRRSEIDEFDATAYWN